MNRLKDPYVIAEDVRDKIIVRYGHRLTKLKVKFAEIRMAVRHPTQSKSSILRLFISNDTRDGTE